MKAAIKKLDFRTLLQENIKYIRFEDDMAASRSTLLPESNLKYKKLIEDDDPRTDDLQQTTEHRDVLEEQPGGEEELEMPKKEVRFSDL